MEFGLEALKGNTVVNTGSIVDRLNCESDLLATKLQWTLGFIHIKAVLRLHLTLNDKN